LIELGHGEGRQCGEPCGQLVRGGVMHVDRAWASACGEVVRALHGASYGTLVDHLDNIVVGQRRQVPIEGTARHACLARQLARRRRAPGERRDDREAYGM